MRISYLLSLCLLIGCYGSGSAYAVNEGITYKSYRPNTATRIHVLTLDPSKVKVIAVRAQDIGQGLSFVSELAQHYKALAAINGGFFRHNQASSVGLPAGVLKIAQEWYGIAYRSRGAIGWDPENNQVLIDVLQTKSALSINKINLPIHAMNKTANANNAYLISDSYIEPILANQNVNIIFSSGRVDAIYKAENFNLPRGSYVYSLGAKLAAKNPTIKIGDPVKLEVTALPQLNKSSTKQWNKLPYIVGGGPLLIYNKKIVTDLSLEKLRSDFIQEPHARTAVGILSDNSWVLVMVEQDILQELSGMTIPELQKFMQSIGCVQAVNLDGGGSSAMFARSVGLGTVTNLNVSLGRPVADALLVLRR